jgi:hypothetical protein
MARRRVQLNLEIGGRPGLTPCLVTRLKPVLPPFFQGEYELKKAATLLIALCAGLLFPSVAVGQTASSPAGAVQSRDARRLRTGVFLYRDMEHGKEVGSSTITIRRLADSGNYQFSADATFSADFNGFHSQRWNAVAMPDFVPVSATLAFVRGEDVVPVFDIRYSQDRVTGKVNKRTGTNSQPERTVDAAIPANTVDQRIDWAAILAGTLETGRQFEFKVYDPVTGISTITGKVGQLETVRIPAGSYHAYHIIYQMQKAGTTEHYQMLASEDSPHVMLREEFPNGVITELVKENSCQPSVASCQ